MDQLKNKKVICPRCTGNGFFKVKESIEKQTDKDIKAHVYEVLKNEKKTND